MKENSLIYDYIFAGFGLSACHVLLQLMETGLLDNRHVLILSDEKNNVEKSWCFWEKGSGSWNSLPIKKWSRGEFISDGIKLECFEDTFTYTYLASKDFIQYTRNKLNHYPLAVILDEAMESWQDHGEVVEVRGNTNEYVGKILFNSAFNASPQSGRNPILLQHFTGWFIESDELPFNADTMTLMDFSMPPQNDTRFMYILPFSENSALVEFTLFSPALLEPEAYEKELRDYLEAIGVTRYNIIRKEAGIIPMTLEPFWKSNTKNVLHIGTAGGWTKPSTGYTFTRALKLSKRIPEFISMKNRDFGTFHPKTRFDFYDRIFIKVLYHRNDLGKKIFTSIFHKAGPNKILLFMKEESTLLQEFSIILACPKIPFLKALLTR